MNSIEAVIQTRETTAKIIVDSLDGCEGNSEIDLRDKILQKISLCSELYPNG